MPFPRHASRRPATRRLPAIVLIAFAVVVLGAASAVAATITVNPSTVPAGGQVTVSGDVLANGSPGCAVPGDVTLISPAFAGLGEFAGVEPPPQRPTSGNFTTTVTLSPSSPRAPMTSPGAARRQPRRERLVDHRADAGGVPPRLTG